MNKNLVVKHKNSLALIHLKKDKLLQEKNESKIVSCSKSCKLAMFCVLVCCIFLIYWIILSPLLISTIYSHNGNKTNKMSIVWLAIYWFIAFIIWLLIMLCLILIWKCFDFNERDNISMQSYGTSNLAKLPSMISTKYNRPQNLRLSNVKEDEVLNDFVSDKKDTDSFEKYQHNKIKKHRDFPPLVIRHNSGNDIESIDIVNLNEGDDKNKKNENSLELENDIPKNHGEFTKNYFKLVTITPEDEIDVKSLQEQLSPRELFFIDLIREADKAERNKANYFKTTEEKYSFSSDNNLIENKFTQETQVEKTQLFKANSSSTEAESSYFIASIESPKQEKTEVYLEIDTDSKPVKRWSVNLNDEKPVLVVQNNFDVRKEDNDEKVVIFEV
ncbi:uncharacterized protein LOC143179748 [Calliopsis andreniformis]|uniref:uncharacterized protein LOC143179748 n=1 Tax=Calliopsis andreniformis TaxID=337506 RepID=UPI003FCDC409